MTISCLVPPLANPMFAEAVQGVQGTLAQTGYQLLISCSNYDGQAHNEALFTQLSEDVDELL